MKALSGKKTYIIAFATAIYVAAYTQGLLPFIDPKTHEMLLVLFGSGAAVTMRQGVAKSGPTPPAPEGGP